MVTKINLGNYLDYHLLVYIFLIPINDAIAIRIPMPPSMGTHGGGQHGGSLDPGGPPPAGWPNTVKEISNSKMVVASIILNFI